MSWTPWKSYPAFQTKSCEPLCNSLLKGTVGIQILSHHYPNTCLLILSHKVPSLLAVCAEHMGTPARHFTSKALYSLCSKANIQLIAKHSNQKQTVLQFDAM